MILLLLIFTSAAWKAADNKEKYGRPMLKAVLLPIAVLTLAIGIIGAISYVKESRSWRESGISAPAQNDREQEAVKTEEGDTKKELLEGKDGGNSLVVWNDSEDTVYLYLLKKDDRDCYTVENKMISESLTKKDVEGKEEGVLKK